MSRPLPDIQSIHCFCPQAHVSLAVSMAFGLKGLCLQQREEGDQLTAIFEGAAGFSLIIVGETALLMTLECLIPTPSFFPNGNRGMPLALQHWRDKLATSSPDAAACRAQAALVGRQLYDGRAFLQGENPSLADIHSASWMLAVTDAGVTAQDRIVGPWLKRMQQLAENSARQQGESLILDIDTLRADPDLSITNTETGTRISSPLDLSPPT